MLWIFLCSIVKPHFEQKFTKSFAFNTVQKYWLLKDCLRLQVWDSFKYVSVTFYKILTRKQWAFEYYRYFSLEYLSLMWLNAYVLSFSIILYSL